MTIHMTLQSVAVRSSHTRAAEASSAQPMARLTKLPQFPLKYRRRCGSDKAFAPCLWQEHLTSGVYTLSDVRCRGCGADMGWRYIIAHRKVRALLWC